MSDLKVNKIIKKINSKLGTKQEDTSKVEVMVETKIEKKSEFNEITKYEEYHTLEAFRNFAEHLKYSPLDQTSSNYKVTYISNGLILGDINSIILKLPPLRIRSIYQVNQKINQSLPIRLSIYTDLPINNKLLTFITRMENEISKKVKARIGNKELKLSSCITKHPEYYPDLKIHAPFTRVNNCVEFKCEIYRKKLRTNFSSLTRGTKTQFWIELDHVWIGEKTFGLNWVILKGKVFLDRKWNIKVFDSDDEEDDDDKPIECFHCMYCPNNHIRTHCCLGTQDNYVPNVSRSFIIPLPPPPPPHGNKPEGSMTNKESALITIQETIKDRYVPSLSDLLLVKSKLKSVNIDSNEANTKEDKKIEGKDIKLQNIKSRLKNL